MSENIKKYEDGKYRWVYEFNMLKNPMIFFTVLKIFVYILIGMWFIFGLFQINDYGFINAFINQAKALLIPAIILFALSILGYIILGTIYGFKYCVIFEMDEEGIRHIQQEKQFQKAQAIAWLEALSGAVNANARLTGTGLLASTKNEQYSEFKKVKKLKALKAFNTIKLDYPTSHNQIYVEDSDYDFVLNYISKHCTNIK